MVKRYLTLCSMALVAILGITVVGIGPASAAPPFTLTVNHTVLVSGHELTVTATSKVSCDWGIRWAGQTRVKLGSTVMVAHFIAPHVTRATKYSVRAICNYKAAPVPWTWPPRRKPGQPPGPSRPPPHDQQWVEATVPPHWFGTIVVTVDPPGTVITPPTSGGHGHSAGAGGGGILLPDTGGPEWWILLIGLCSLLVGTVTVRIARGRVVLT